MIDNRNTTLNILYGLAGLCCATWLIVSLNSASNQTVNEPINQGSKQNLLVSSNNDKKEIKQRLDQDQRSLEKVTIDSDNTDLGKCSLGCNSALSTLDQDLELDDDTFDKLEAYAEDIAAYLQDHETKRSHYIQVALTTTDGDKRAFLTDVFQHLPYQQKVEIGGDFIESENWQVRADGVALIADHDISTLEVANTLLSIFSTENNSYIKGNILSYLKQDSTLQGDVEILRQLDSAIYGQTEPRIRVEAFKTKMQLIEQPYHILPDALQALRTDEVTLQFASLNALEKILKHERKYIENGIYIDRNSIKSEVQIIRNLAAYDYNKKHYDRLIREADAIYLRYFGP